MSVFKFDCSPNQEKSKYGRRMVLEKKRKILFLGQTPPPHHGQAIVIEKILSQDYEKVELVFVRLDFSSSLSEVGKFKISKITALLGVLFRSLNALISQRIYAIYYPPSGHSMVPVIRDIILLSFFRLFRKKLILHFHILGLKHFYESSSRLLKFFLRRSFLHPDLCICVSEKNIEDISFLEAKRNVTIPNGIEDKYLKFINSTPKKEGPIEILYVGNLYKAKGVSLLLDSFEILLNKGIEARLILVGGFKDKSYEKEVKSHAIYGNENVIFRGVLTGDEKWNEFAKADIFCFPPIGKESFSMVTVEAMSFQLPIITTEPRAAYDRMIVDNENGFLSPKDPSELSVRLEKLIMDKKLRDRMGTYSRKLFLDRFEDSIFNKNIKQLLNDLS